MNQRTVEHLEARAAEQDRLAGEAVRLAQQAEESERWSDAQHCYLCAYEHRCKAKRIRAAVREFTVL